MGFGTFFFVGLLFTLQFMQATKDLDFYAKGAYLGKVFWSFVLVLLFFALFAFVIFAVLYGLLPGVKEAAWSSFMDK